MTYARHPIQTYQSPYPLSPGPLSLRTLLLVVQAIQEMSPRIFISCILKLTLTSYENHFSLCYRNMLPYFPSLILSSLVLVNVPKAPLPHSLWRGFAALVSTEEGKQAWASDDTSEEQAGSLSDSSRGEFRALAGISAERTGLKGKQWENSRAKIEIGLLSEHWK